MAHKLFESRSRQSVVSEDSMKERGRERSERDRESGETDTDEETLEGTVMILSFRTDRSGENSADPVWSGSTVFAIPAAFFGCITLW